MKKALILGHTLPEPATTAAGNRMMQLIIMLMEEGYAITFASTAAPSKHSIDLSALKVHVETIQLNHSSFDEFVIKLQPCIVLFDRYITEEQFGWRVAENCPNALRILDTEDLHFLRKAREMAVKNDMAVGDADLYTEVAKREISSILRSDLSLIISEFELELLGESFGVPRSLLHYLPFVIDALPEELNAETNSFTKRQGFMTIGNLLHAPNVDSVLYLKKEIWPRIRKQLADVTIAIYGNYASQQILDLHNEQEGFYIKGWAQYLSEVMCAHRICLAPLRFGAGLKGKLFDAMCCGLPSVTSAIGAEGMAGEFPFAGIVADTPEEFAAAAVRLYTDSTTWEKAREHGFEIVSNRFLKSRHSELFKSRIAHLQENLTLHRKAHFIGQILQHQSLQSSKYMSKWIEEKGKTTR